MLWSQAVGDRAEAGPLLGVAHDFPTADLPQPRRVVLISAWPISRSADPRYGPSPPTCGV
ncbi:hypothetical protein STRTUCAR8_09934 [Streptomyces turgidiscabies Car8]|uniref:Uncharacterized protein n=1 Tax=Streptomyces turgidiscabies (strain Car8) TaxID=698760 RepID=L7ET42_STRT8|nr:hypothetical protein STRTUCAR8_09934 [Streptomyces turgidiscabies Car8]